MERVIPMEPTEASDRELVAQCQAGAVDAFEMLVSRHHARAFNIAYQLLRDREDATEVAQDAFVRIYRNLSEFRGDCEFTTWLHRIVVNLARNKHRWWHRRGREKMESLDAPRAKSDGMAERQFASDAATPDAELAQAELARQLGDKLAGLPARYREVLVLRNIENLSYEEIAGVLQCSLGTVKSRIARARVALRAAMQNE